MSDELRFAYTPFGEQKEIILTPALVSDVLAVRTRKGIGPSKADIRIYLERCAAQGMNPFLGDAYLIGYDNDDGTATFSMITAHQSLLKRAEPHPQYDGIESGVIVIRKDLMPKEPLRDTKPTPEEIEAARAASKPLADLAVKRTGELIYPDEIVVGGWAKVFRRDRSRPAVAELTFSVYDTTKSRWRKDPGGMIVKCAEASALREAFPTMLAGMYIAQEMDAIAANQHALTDERAAQSENVIVIPPANQNVDGDRRACVPTDQRPKVHDLPKTVAETRQNADTGPQSSDTREQSSDTDRKSTETREPVREPEEELPGPITELLSKIRGAKTETSLSVLKLRWRDLKASFPNHDDRVSKAIEAASQRVIPAGGK